MLGGIWRRTRALLFGGATMAFFARCRTGTPKAVREDLSFGADVNAKDEDGWTALMYTAHNPNPEIIAVRNSGHFVSPTVVSKPCCSI